MEKFNVGPEELSEYDWPYLNNPNLTWLVVWYEQGSYDGSGLAAGLTTNGNIEYKDLGHCSCFGPLDNGNEWKEVTIEAFLKLGEEDSDMTHRKRRVEDFDYQQWKSVVDKVRELVSLQPSNS